MNKKVVAVIFGGQSSEHEISKISASTIISNISQEKYYIIPIYITKNGEWKIYEGALENISNSGWEKYSASAILSPDTNHKGIIRIVGEKLKFIPIDIVFPVLHGKYGEDGTLQGLLELSNIPYVGCGVLSSAISMDKAYTKIVADSIGINQAKYKIVHKYELKNISSVCKDLEKQIGYPCYIKPANAGSSKGITKAENKDELIAGLNLAGNHDLKIIVEKNIVGREVECAVLGNNDVSASKVGEVLSVTQFYDFDAKYNNKESKTVIPANIPEKVSEEIRKNAIKIFKALDGKGLSRVDFFIENETNKVIFNEINTLPGFTSISMYHMLWKEEGIDLPNLMDKLLELAFENFKEKNEIKSLTE
ncbi:MAG: D-alanine--D-alanine ligase [Eubacteriales bacterium]|nr:D-alanine--D-alanine ligase [Eubacteriales bacterium]